MNKSTRTSRLPVLLFLLQNIRFCADLKYINKIISLPLLEAVPNSPRFLAGLLNISGKSIPVIDLAIRIGLTRNQPYALETPILICQHQTQIIGIIVDEVLSLTEISAESLQMKSEFNDPSSFFMAAAEINAELSLLINMENILSFDLNAKKNNCNNNALDLTDYKYEKS